jgi:serpin B
LLRDGTSRTAEHLRRALNFVLVLLVLSPGFSPASRAWESSGESHDTAVRAPATAEDIAVRAAPAVTANNAFALDLFARLAGKGDDNVFFSPYSILNALAMTELGARGRTADQMEKALHFPARLEEFHPALSALNAHLRTDSVAARAAAAEIEQLRAEQARLAGQAKANRERRAPDWELEQKLAEDEASIVEKINLLLGGTDPTEITVANALWGEKTYRFNENYLDSVNEYYGTGAVELVDFRNQAEAQRVRINEWAERMTRNRITNVLPAGSVDDSTRMILANAIYFKSEWEEPFEVTRTMDEDFTLASGTKVKTRLMRREEIGGARHGAFHADGSPFATPVDLAPGDEATPRYPGEDGFAIVELPYRGGRFAMVILAPNSPEGLPAVEKRLTADTLSVWLGRLSRRRTTVILPKFRAETSYALDGILEPLGMVDAFTRPMPYGGADFTGMADRRELYISLVQHKAYVDVNEEGTEAAAVTAVEVSWGGIEERQRIPFIPEFRADRPFLYWIRDVRSGCVLFMGRMTHPQKA